MSRCSCSLFLQTRLLGLMPLAILALLPLHLQIAHAADPKAEQKKEEAAVAEEKSQEGLEYICECSVFYSWERTPTPPTDSKTPDSPKPPSETVEVFYSQVGQSALSEAEARERLSLKLPRLQAEAMEACRKEHEHIAACLAERLKRLSEDYSRLDYSARHAMLEAISAECDTNKGRCLSARSGEATCYQNILPGSEVGKPAGEGSAEQQQVGKDQKESKKGEKK